MSKYLKKKYVVYIYKMSFQCTICNCRFSEGEGGLHRGVIGMIPVFFCPTCFNGLLEMGDYFRSSYIDRGTDDED